MTFFDEIGKRCNKKKFYLFFVGAVATLSIVNHFMLPTKVGATIHNTEKVEEEILIPTTPVFINTKHNKVRGVLSFTDAFPDQNDVQILAAERNGVRPMSSRKQVEKMVAEHKLVCINNSPYFAVDRLTHSLPYLVPRAYQLLQTISINFIDSLQSKGLKPHIPIVTSVLRTDEDINKLRRSGNVNSITNSAHCYGTTVDITYTRFMPLVDNPGEEKIEQTKYDFTLQQVLSEVLNDLRKKGACYVKYERLQACYHLTVR